MRQKTNFKLKAMRGLRGLRQGDLAGKIGRSQSWLRQLERGDIDPTEIDVALICRALNVLPEAILADNDSGSTCRKGREPVEIIEVTDA